MCEIKSSTVDKVNGTSNCPGQNCEQVSQCFTPCARLFDICMYMPY